MSKEEARGSGFVLLRNRDFHGSFFGCTALTGFVYMQRSAAGWVSASCTDKHRTARMDAPGLIVRCDALRTIDKARGSRTRMENNLITPFRFHPHLDTFRNGT